MDRISAIISMAHPVMCIADVGCDHGEIGYGLLQSKKCQRVWMIDRSQASLEKAKALFLQNRVMEKATFTIVDGLGEAQGIDAAVIAGLGGRTIVEMLKKDLQIVKNLQYLILGPQNRERELRESFFDLGLCIVDELLLEEHNRHYAFMTVKAGKQKTMTMVEKELGPMNMKKRDEAVLTFAKKRWTMVEQSIANLSGMNKPNLSNFMVLRTELDQYLKMEESKR